MVAALPGVALIARPVEGAEALLALGDDRALGQRVAERTGDFALAVDAFGTDAQPGVSGVAFDLDVGVLDRTVADGIDDLQAKGAVEITLRVEPEVLAAIAVVVARVVNEIEGHAHPQAHRAFFEKVEFGLGVVLLANQDRLAVVGTTCLGAADQAHPGGEV